MIKFMVLASLAISIIGLGVAQVAAQTTFKVGVTTRQFVPAEHYEWRGDAKHRLATTIWYPADPGADEKPQLRGPPGNPLFDGGQAAADAALAPTPAKFPLIVLSHGTGGTGGSLAWLGTALARAGYVAAAVDHPGNNAIDGYTVEGFTLWWERARDLSAVIDGMLADPGFMARIDGQRVGAAGFSLGGYTAIVIAGGITSLAHYRDFCASAQADASCQAPPEFGDLRAKAKALADTDEAYRAALANDGRSYRDPRVRAVFAMAPALGPTFLPKASNGSTPGGDRRRCRRRDRTGRQQRAILCRAYPACRADDLPRRGRALRLYRGLHPGRACCGAGAVRRRARCGSRRNPCRDRAARRRVLRSAPAIGSSSAGATEAVVKTEGIAGSAGRGILTRVDD